jgi:hypothetical protein
MTPSSVILFVFVGCELPICRKSIDVFYIDEVEVFQALCLFKPGSSHPNFSPTLQP